MHSFVIRLGGLVCGQVGRFKPRWAGHMLRLKGSHHPEQRGIFFLLLFHGNTPNVCLCVCYKNSSAACKLECKPGQSSNNFTKGIKWFHTRTFMLLKGHICFVRYYRGFSVCSLKDSKIYIGLLKRWRDYQTVPHSTFKLFLFKLL